MTNHIILLSRTAVGTAAMLLASTAIAQTAEPVTQDGASPGTTAGAAGARNDDADRIIITGSRIRGIEPVGSDVIAIDQDEIATTPVVSANDLLRRVPQVVALGANRQGGTAQNAAANATRGAGINLRGLGIGATLLLYDGKRFPPQGTQGQYTDPSVLPTIALERVEVVADGASAIYGSDAIAGVVNFILRRNFDGAEFRARSGFTDDGSYDEQQIAGIVGKKWQGGSAMLSAEYSRNSALFGRELDFFQDDNRDRGGRDLRATFCNPGTISVGGSSYAIPTGGVTPATVGLLTPGTSNRCFYNGLEAVIPEQQRYNVVGAVSQEITDGIRLFADGFYSYRKGTIPGLGNVTAAVRDTNPFFVSPVPGATQVNVTWSPIPETGALVNPYRGDSWNVSAGVEADLFHDWTGTVYYAHGASEDVADRHLGLNGGAINAALADTDPATALNVFGGPNNPDTLARITDNLFVITGRTRLDVVNGQVEGALFQLPGGAVRLAVGGEYRKEYTYTDLIIGTSAASNHVTDDGSRNVKAVFGELFVPIVGAGNAMPGIEQLSLSVAGRYEKYSDFGDTANPKIGLTYKPIEQVTLRGSYGTSFRAPGFVEVSTTAGGAGLYYDTLPGPSGNLTGIGLAGGNPGLKPETATTWSVGADVRPTDGLLATLTYFDIEYTNQIQALRGTAGLLTNPLYSSFVKFNPTPAEVEALVNSGLPINSPINTSNVQFIADGRRQNLGTTLVNGIDFGLYYQREIGAVSLDAGVQGTYYTRYHFEPIPDAGFSNVLGTINFPQKFRSQADIGLKWREFATRLTWNHLAGYKNTSVNPVQEVRSYNTVDLFLGWDVNEHFRFSIDARNLFNEGPPFVDVARGYDPQSTNPVPRLISVTATMKL
jgi:iron complex outermembrane receptor protein